MCYGNVNFDSLGVEDLIPWVARVGSKPIKSTPPLDSRAVKKVRMNFPAQTRDESTKYAGDRPNKTFAHNHKLAPKTGTPRDGGTLVDARARDITRLRCNWRCDGLKRPVPARSFNKCLAAEKKQRLCTNSHHRHMRR